MTTGTIFLVDGGGRLLRMSPSAPRSEDHMQALVAQYPELIGDSDGQLLLIRREQPIRDSADGAGRWSLDHLFVTRNAVPVLVELKRAVDTRLRREVVGQLLDYAANGVAYWQPGRIAEAFVATCAETGRDPDETVRAFLAGDDPEPFWDQVDANFQAGRIKLVFVADTISPELARIVEFLNEQMRADVRAVELNWFQGDGNVTTLVPRVIGETQRAAAQRNARAVLEAMSTEEWIERHIRPAGAEAVRGAAAYVEWIGQLGGRVTVTKLHGSIIAEFIGHDGKPVYPIKLNDRGVVLLFKYLHTRPGLAEESERRRHYDAFVRVVGPMTTDNTRGAPSFNVALLADDDLREALTPVARSFLDAAMASGAR